MTVNTKNLVIVSNIFDEQDWTPFECHYASSGRAPYSPHSMIGFILSRGFEQLARLDLDVSL
ncbi:MULTISPECIES: hypothetical protein [Photorhabdus]|uniref:hypothetical protein n=1 Tax=Photorhabdus TaxID=29487 RepID=UPI000A7B70D1|nr:hypothetical protein [Photorhabdus thracensis]